MNYVTWLAGIAAVAVLGTGSMGCNRFTGYCSYMMDCVNGNDMDHDACVAEAEAAADEADAYDCGDDFDSLYTCQKDEAHCYRDTGGHWTYGPEGRCDHEDQALSDCKAHASRLH